MTDTSESYRQAWNNSQVFDFYDERRVMVAPVMEAVLDGVIRANFASGNLVVEIGAGAGAVTKYSGDLTSDFCWIETDQNAQFLTLPRGHKHARAAVALPTLPFAHESVDGLFGMGVIDTFSTGDLADTATASFNVLRGGGRFVHLMDMGPDYIAEIKNARSRKLFPLIASSEGDDGQMALDFVQLKNLPRRISRLPIDQSTRNVFMSIVEDPETYVPRTNRTGILQYLGKIARDFEMVVESHPSWFIYQGERYASAFEAAGFIVIGNSREVLEIITTEEQLPPFLRNKGVTKVERRNGFSNTDSETGGKPYDGPISMAMEYHVFSAEKPVSA